jgi:hypothetical protein
MAQCKISDGYVRDTKHYDPGLLAIPHRPTYQGHYWHSVWPLLRSILLSRYFSANKREIT